MDTWVLYVGLLGVFAGVAILLTAVGGLTTERATVARSLAAVEAIESAPKSMRPELDPSFSDRVLTPAWARLIRIGRRFTPMGRAERLRVKLELAGNPVGWDVDRVLASKALGLIVGIAIGVGVPLLVGNFLWAVLFGVALGFLGFYAADLMLYQVAYNRTDAITKSLPDALDMLMISVESGLGFDAALAQVAKNTTGPLAEELFRVLQEMQLGTGRADALRGLVDRTDVSDLRTFVTAMLQADTLGIPIANVLRVQAKEMRLKRSQRAEEQAQKVPVKILFPLIFFILPSLFVIILGPAAISIYDTLIRGT